MQILMNIFLCNIDKKNSYIAPCCIIIEYLQNKYFP